MSVPATRVIPFLCKAFTMSIKDFIITFPRFISSSSVLPVLVKSGFRGFGSEEKSGSISVMLSFTDERPIQIRRVSDRSPRYVPSEISSQPRFAESEKSMAPVVLFLFMMEYTYCT